jgi:hypothetical protein
MARLGPTNTPLFYMMAIIQHLSKGQPPAKKIFFGRAACHPPQAPHKLRAFIYGISVSARVVRRGTTAQGYAAMHRTRHLRSISGELN